MNVLVIAEHRADARFVGWINGCLQATPYDVVLPLSDHTTRPIVESDVGTLTHTTLPDAQTLQLSHDKLAVLQIAESLGPSSPSGAC